ncbi:PVC-type heme-binding CxxCH protein [Humisphaera borealis]|uniref:C-type cytochrome n=1 Tax=Humisphaera borealis TaxID=2807512 RepID=A0A7M2WVI2_9BACT|nr:PVC-type heme-binding CxxCH protein [Humisphaera borealis]QOV89334.1 c-type cytochrome [Humisphaera borealis]
MKALFALSILSLAFPAMAKSPVALDERLAIELIAQEPAIVTPTGVFADVRDNVWAIECNTHFPPKDYKGYPTDRIFVFSGYEQADAGAPTTRPGTAVAGGTGEGIDPKTGLAPGVQRTTFADGLMQAMSLTMTPAGKIYVVCRNEIVYFEDKNHDLKPDELDLGDGKKGDRKVLLRLDTKATYPHNGLNGATLSPDGEFLYFCLGLNTGFDYSVIGSDGSKISGGGEGGSVWRCTPAGGKVERIAIGFWNCHDLTFDAFGRLFAVDNDPDDIGPCRLLDIIEGGDYGWKFKNGRKGVHPFTSWNGELPGTLPMVAPTGEAPSGILAYESDNWPADYLGQVLVTSWGDHTIQRFELKEKGASFTSTPVNIIRGGDDFRPVGITQASDGSVFFTDWVDKSYTLHLKGKLWRIRAQAPTTQPAQKETGGSAAGSVAKRLRVDEVTKAPQSELIQLCSAPRREIRIAAGDSLAASGDTGLRELVKLYVVEKDRPLIDAYWSLKRRERAEGPQSLLRALMTELSPLPKISQPGDNVFADRIVRYPDVGNSSQSLRRLLTFLGQDSAAQRRDTLLGLCKVLDVTARSDPFLNAAAIHALSKNSILPEDALTRESAVLAPFYPLIARRNGSPEAVALLPKFLKSPDPAVRRVALQWIGEDRLVQFKDNLPDALKAGDVTRDLLATYLAAQEKLNTPLPEPGKPPAERSVSQFAVEFLLDEKNDAKLRKVALELVNPTDAKPSSKQLVALIEPMGLAAIQAIAWRDDPESQAALRAVAADAKRDIAERREAVLGLARSALASAETKSVLREILLGRGTRRVPAAEAKDPPTPITADKPNGVRGERNPANGIVDPAGKRRVPLQAATEADLRLDALKAMRGALDAADGKALVDELMSAATKKQPDGTAVLNEAEWAEQIMLAFKPTPEALSAADRKRLEPLLPQRSPLLWQVIGSGADRDSRPVGDPDAGRRVFALATGARCYVCHQFDGRGGAVGPDLSRVRSAMDDAKIVESIIEPSKEIAPLYVSSIIELKNGDTISGVGLNEAGAAYVAIADATGKRHRIKAEDIVSRREEKISVMPEGLVDTMSVQEFRDLLAYLRRL